MGAAEFEKLMRHQAHDQTDAELEQKRLGSAGDICGGQVRDGHAHRARQAAPISAQQQGCKHAEHIAEVKGCFFRAYGNVNFEKSEADVAQRGQQTGLG